MPTEQIKPQIPEPIMCCEDTDSFLKIGKRNPGRARGGEKGVFFLGQPFINQRPGTLSKEDRPKKKRETHHMGERKKRKLRDWALRQKLWGNPFVQLRRKGQEDPKKKGPLFREKRSAGPSAC